MLKAELTGLEADLGNHRDAVTKVKFQRDQLRQENAKLKASAVNVLFSHCSPPALTFCTGKERFGGQRFAPERFRPAQAGNREHGSAHDVVEGGASAADQGGQAAFGTVGKADWLDAEAVATRINVVYVCALAKVLCARRVPCRRACCRIYCKKKHNRIVAGKSRREN